MALLKPNATYKINGVCVNEKIIPDGTRWKNAKKAAACGFAQNSLYKKQQRLTKNTGKSLTVTIHNTADIANVPDAAEQYTRATYNENMGSARVHFYVDDVGAWQNLRAGTGMCTNDPEGSAEVSWHAGDGSVFDGGNMTSISVEIIMGNSDSASDRAAYDNGARLAAWLLYRHGLDISALVTHTYWVNKNAGNLFFDVDEQCANPVYGKKWCPAYIFGSSDKKEALKNWKRFKGAVKKYMTECKNDLPQDTFSPYLVRIKPEKVYIYSGPGTDNSIVNSIASGGVYTVVDEADGKGSSKWGYLKSGAGWIPLDKTTKY